MDIPESLAVDVQAELRSRILPRFRDPSLEESYLHYNYHSRIFVIRLGLILGVVLFLGLRPLAEIQLPDAILPLDWQARIVLQIPLTIGVLLVSIFVRNPRIVEMTILLGLSVIFISNSLLIRTGGPESLGFYEISIYQLIVFGCLILSLRFRPTILCFMAVCCIHVFIVQDIGEVVTVQGVETVPYGGPIFFLLVIGFAAYSIDIAARRSFLATRALNREYRERTAAQDNVNRWLRTITDFLRHELKNSLIGISSSLELIKRRNSDASLRSYLERADESAKFMKRLLDEASASTNLESTLEGMNFEKVDLAELVEAKMDDYQTMYPDNRFELQLSKPVFVTCDTDRIIQVLDKLINNAVEHGSKEAPVIVSISSNNDTAILCVIDKGEPLDESIEVFEPFVSGKARSSENGFGFGLYIVRKIVEAHGGSTEAKRLNDPEGAAFTVRLPLADPAD